MQVRRTRCIPRMANSPHACASSAPSLAFSPIRSAVSACARPALRQRRVDLTTARGRHRRPWASKAALCDVPYAGIAAGCRRVPSRRRLRTSPGASVPIFSASTSAFVHHRHLRPSSPTDAPTHERSPTSCRRRAYRATRLDHGSTMAGVSLGTTTPSTALASPPASSQSERMSSTTSVAE